MSMSVIVAGLSSQPAWADDTLDPATTGEMTLSREFTILSDGETGIASSTIFFYEFRSARSYAGVRYDRIEGCATGGAQFSEGWFGRLAGTRVAMGMKGTPATTLIAWKWGTKPSHGSLSSSLGFSVGGGPVSVSGSIPMRDDGYFSGNPGSDSLMGRNVPNSANQVNGHWRQSGRFGVSDWMGQVTHGLWEVKQTERARYGLTMMLKAGIDTVRL